MKIGLIARMDNGGLGNQTWELFKHLQPQKTVVIDLREFNGNEQHGERYLDKSDVMFYKANKYSMLNNECMQWLTDDIDVIITCEIPYNYELFNIARQKDVKTVLQYNYEFLDYLQNENLPKPDLFLAPSMWHFEDVKFKNKKFLPVPVNRDLLPFKLKEKAKTFLHIAGSKLHEDRNGTEIVLKAINHVKKDVKFIIYSQHELQKINDKRVEIRELNLDNYWDLYKDGDVLLLPRRYGGLSLQLNEAMSCGMVPIMSDVMPQNKILCNESLLPVVETKETMTRTKIEVNSISYLDLAEEIDIMASMDRNKFRSLSMYSDIYAESISWTNLRSKYIKLFENLIKKE